MPRRKCTPDNTRKQVFWARASAGINWQRLIPCPAVSSPCSPPWHLGTGVAHRCSCHPLLSTEDEERSVLIMEAFFSNLASNFHDSFSIGIFFVGGFGGGFGCLVFLSGRRAKMCTPIYIRGLYI